MRRAFIFCIAFLLLVSIPSGFEETDLQVTKLTEPSQLYLPIERDWTTNIVVVGYDPALIDEAILLQGLPDDRNYYTGDVHITYNIDYEVSYADSSYLDDLRQEMLDNSVNGSSTGTWLNETALSYQKSHPDEPQRIFYPRDGRVIDGFAIEDWLEENPYVTPPDLGYTLYLVNFSEFDSADHGLEHWYDYHPMDPDTGEEQDWFRLEWDNELNPDVTMDFQFLGGRSRSYLVDPSAHQWYLRWCRIWWSQFIDTEYDFWTQDLEDKVGSLNLANPSHVDALNDYLRECIWDPINLLFFPYQHQPASYVESGNLKALVICMDVANGTSVESLEWVTNAEMQKAHLEELYPFIDWTVDVEFLDIDDSPFWTSIFWGNASLEPDGTTAVNGSEMFYDIYNNVRPSYVPDDGNINVFGVVFIKKQMIMYTHGGTYTGLGGGGQTVIWKSWERYYRPDGVTPKDGISSVQLHETMHAIGFHHTWQHEHYASDFSWGPMGYFAFHNGTASFDKNWVQSTYLDQMEAYLWDDFLTEAAALGIGGRPETATAEAAALAAFTRARVLYNEMNWLEAYEALKDARDWTKRMKFSAIDSIPPVIGEWGTDPHPIGTGGFHYWVIVTDNLAGVENVTLHVQVDNGAILTFPCSSTGDNWSVLVPSLGQTSTINIWVIAWDWGMNMAEGGNIESGGLLLPIAVAAGGGVAAIAAGAYIYRRRK